MAMSKRVLTRVSTQLKRYRTILSEAKDGDISESNTAAIVRDMLSDVFGYKKFSEITSEFAIRSTNVDLAVKVGDDLRFLVETKAVGVSLNDNHVRQTIDYGANHGIEWVILTNGITWRIYKIHFSKPVEKTLILELDLLRDSPRDPQLLECFWSLSREGFTPSSMNAFFQQQQVTSKFSLAALLLTDPLIKALRRELRRWFPKVRIREDLLFNVLRNDVLKRELVDGDEAREAAQFLMHAIRKASRRKTSETGETPTGPTVTSPQIVEPPVGTLKA
jgi:hypothetical protein